jgi:hypothetical protein
VFAQLVECAAVVRVQQVQQLAPAGIGQGAGCRSDQSMLRKRQTAVVGNDHVIEHADVDQLQGFAQPARDQLIGLARFGDAGRMLGCISGCHRHLFDCLPALQCRRLSVAQPSVRGE